MVTTTTRNQLVDSPREFPGGGAITAPLTEEAQFKLFAILWAIATLFHMAHSSTFDTQFDFALLTLSALYVIFRPSLAGFLVFIGVQIFDALYRMPFTTNHWIFTAFVNLTILHALIYAIIRNRSFQVNSGELLKIFSPLVKIELIILYFFAVFHKLNTGFFADGSCATDLLRAQNIDNYITLSPEFYRMNAYLTLLIEALIPLMLCFRSTRSAGLIIGVVFHCILSYSSYNAFYDFSSMVFAVYFLFTAPELSVRIIAHMKEIKVKTLRTLSPSTFSYTRLFVIGLIFFVGLIVIYLLTKKLTDYKSVHLYFFWTIYSVCYLYFFVRCQIFNNTVDQPKNASFAWRPAHVALLIIPLIVFLNGMSPYFGLKTENSYAMFSNLKTEAGSSNHLIVPASVQIFDYQKDAVDIVSSSDPTLQKIASANLSMVWFELTNYLHEQKPETVTYRRNGQTYTYHRGDRSTHPPKNNYVLGKLMKFRVFNKDGVQPCAH